MGDVQDNSRVRWADPEGRLSSRPFIDLQEARGLDPARACVVAGWHKNSGWSSGAVLFSAGALAARTGTYMRLAASRHCTRRCDELTKYRDEHLLNYELYPLTRAEHAHFLGREFWAHYVWQFNKERS